MIDPILLMFSATVFGLMIGSFLNVVIHRLPLMMEREWRADCAALDGGEATIDGETEPFDLVRPRSRCPGCGEKIAGYDNIPVLSYLLLGGKCRRCESAISIRYPLVEAATGAVTCLAAFAFGFPDGLPTTDSIIHVAAVSVFAWYLIALAMIDFDTQLLPDSLTMPLLWFGIALGFSDAYPVTLEDAVLGAMFGYLSLWSVYWAFKLVTGKEGMGYGDFKLLSALGAWLGWQALPALILVSSAVGAIIGVMLLSTSFVKRSEPIPFGPYLALAGLIMMFWGGRVSDLFNIGTGI